MTYELAKKLKDAGWRQKGRITIAEDEKTYECCRPENCYCPKCEDYDKNWAIVPSLSELIEACGKRFLELYYHIEKNPALGDIEGWRAYERGGAGEGVGELGMIDAQTPEEAVANLWLVLKKLKVVASKTK